PADETLTRHANHQRQVERVEAVKVIQQRQVLFTCFTEAYARIKDELLTPHAARFGFSEGDVHVAFDFGKDVWTWRDLLHRRRLAAHMHQHERRLRLRRDLSDLRVKA